MYWLSSAWGSKKLGSNLYSWQLIPTHQNTAFSHLKKRYKNYSWHTLKNPSNWPNLTVKQPSAFSHQRKKKNPPKHLIIFWRRNQYFNFKKNQLNWPDMSTTCVILGSKRRFCSDFSLSDMVQEVKIWRNGRGSGSYCWLSWECYSHVVHGSIDSPKTSMRMSTSQIGPEADDMEG